MSYAHLQHGTHLMVESPHLMFSTGSKQFWAKSYVLPLQQITLKAEDLVFVSYIKDILLSNGGGGGVCMAET